MTLTIESVADALTLKKQDLKQLLVQGHPIEMDALAGYVYKGTSLGMPGWVDKIAWKTFAKTFYKDPQSGELRGWNIKLKQGTGDALVPLTSRGKPKTFGHYKVRLGKDYKMPLPCQHGLMLDYGLGKNPRLDPARFIRDPLLSIQPGNADFLIGWSYVDIRGKLLGTPSFFVLERHSPIDFIPGA